MAHDELRKRIIFERDSSDATKLVIHAHMGFWVSFSVGSQVFHPDFALGDGSYAWRIETGYYDINGQRVYGYWIFKADGENECIQAQDGDGALVYWNSDGQAQGYPQDWELFIFEYADTTQQTVRIRNLYGSYITLRGHYYSCNGKAEEAGAFFPTISREIDPDP